MAFRQVADPTLQCKIVADGIAVVGKTWNFLETDTNISIRVPLFCDQLRARHYYLKGFQFYGNPRYLYRIPLFQLYKYKVDLCLYDFGDEHLNYANICKFVTNCLQESVDQLPDSATFELLYQSTIPHLKDRSGTSDFSIMIADFERWVMIMN